jgi:hypothetical protein
MYVDNTLMLSSAPGANSLKDATDFRFGARACAPDSVSGVGAARPLFNGTANFSFTFNSCDRAQNVEVPGATRLRDSKSKSTVS